MKGSSTSKYSIKGVLNSDAILYEDNHVIIVNKLPSQIVQGDKTGDIPLVEIVKEYIKEKYEKPGEVFLGVVHRLDRPVSGAVIFARTSKSLSRLNAQIKDRKIKKTYWAVVKNKPPENEATLVNYLKRNEEKNKSFIVSAPDQKAKEASLTYKVIASSDNYYLLEVDLQTGRHHQIRVQLAGIGCPIKGDLKYGYPRSNADGSIHLHARILNFIHPVSLLQLCVIASPPSDSIWDFFKNNI
jgi:23S rRNA pseudouridine1911/1915/1917 synthase